LTLPEYGFFWLTVLALFDYLYGRHFRAVARLLLNDDANGQRTALLERLDHMLSRLWGRPEYVDTRGDVARNDDHVSSSN
jgi:hypothetical protein